jgi:hypothetical protein
MSKQPEPVNYNAFVDSEEQRPTNSGLKVKNKYTSTGNNFSDAEFERASQQAILNSKKLAEQIKKASDDYVKLISLKTTSENRTSVNKQMESDIISNLLELAVEVNKDPTQPIAAGAIGLNALILKICLMQRDIINDLSYNCYQMSKVLDTIVSDEK